MNVNFKQILIHEGNSHVTCLQSPNFQYDCCQSSLDKHFVLAYLHNIHIHIHKSLLDKYILLQYTDLTQNT